VIKFAKPMSPILIDSLEKQAPPTFCNSVFNSNYQPLEKGPTVLEVER
jgi:hypothetical protein